ncbi:MAG: PTS glucose transporter subunit IIA [Paenibacillaceae bacterium]
MKQSIAISSPMSGEVIRLEQVPDLAFAQKRMGDGVAIIPSNGRLMAPFDGIVLHLVSTKHAIIVQHASGLQLLMHFGLNTVHLQGKGFTSHVANGDRVYAGQLMMEIDLDLLASLGYSTCTPIVVANEDYRVQIDSSYKTVQAGDSGMMNVVLPV